VTVTGNRREENAGNGQCSLLAAVVSDGMGGVEKNKEKKD